MTKPGRNPFLTITATWGVCWIVAAVPAASAQGTFLEPDVTVLHAFHQNVANFGWAVAELVDIDNPPDGAMDLIIPSTGAGTVWVYSGTSGNVLHVLVGPGESQGFGSAVSDAGDTDGDGVHDIAVGAPGSGFGAYPGIVYLYSGADGSLLLSIPGEAAGSQFGFGVGGVGDVNADGFDDIVAGAPSFNGNAGRGYIVSGLDGSFLHVFDGEAGGDSLGIGAAGAGDINGDGVGDAIFGAQGAGANGKAYVYSGVDGALIVETLAQAGSTAYGQFFVDGVGDVNNDGTPDLYVGDYAASGGRGRAYVHSGIDGSVLHIFEGDPGDGLGPGRGTGDVDGDGFADLIIGHYTNDSGGTNAGRVTIRSGRTGRILRTITSTTPLEALGFDAVGVGDVNGDGFIDYLLSASSGSNVYVIAGYEFASCQLAAPPQVVVDAVDANRYLSVSPPADGQPSALRVTLTDVAGFSGSNGEVRWAGPPGPHPDGGSGAGNTFTASQLQCTPFFTDWSTIGRLYLFGAEVVPGSRYTIQAVSQDCGAGTAEENFSSGVELMTQRWGDIVAPFWSPTLAQPDFNDIAAVVQTFIDAQAAPNKPRAQLQPNVPVPSEGVDFRDIAATVSAFVGDSYPFDGPGACMP